MTKKLTRKPILLSLLLLTACSDTSTESKISQTAENSRSVEGEKPSGNKVENKKITTEITNDEQFATKQLPILSYQEFLTQVKTKKSQIKNVSDGKNYLFNLYNKDIANYWIDTKWDFNGVTREPQNGKIACGYFVTNTLSDLGFNLQRVKLAQAPSSKMIKELTVNVKHFADINKLIDHIQKEPNNSLYIVGLDFHTGFLLESDNEVYFLHSSYIKRTGVVKEVAKNSVALNQSKSFMVGSLTANDKLIRQWVGL